MQATAHRPPMFFKEVLITLSLTLFLVLFLLHSRLFLTRLKTEVVIEQFGILQFTMVSFLHSPTVHCTVAAVWFSPYETIFSVRYGSVQFSLLTEQ